MENKPHILFLCMANSMRSQMGEGLARKLWGENVVVHSAGRFSSQVSPYAIAVMQEVGMDIRGHRSKPVSSLDVEQMRVIITLCAERVCPPTSPSVVQLHWPIADPVAGLIDPSDEEILQRFRETRDEIDGRLQSFDFRALGI